MTAYARPGVGRDDLVADGAPPLAGMNPASMEGPTRRPGTRSTLCSTPTDRPPTTWCRYRPPELEPFKRIDEVRFELGLPNTSDLG
ncbi:hypothetical protein ACWD7T_00565 [Streptomyces sp. 900116325]